jgi:hypothetical protein
MLTSSTNTFKNQLVQSLNIFAIVLENVLVVFFRLNGTTFQSYKPDLMIALVFFTFSGAIGIFLKLDHKSNAKNH